MKFIKNGDVTCISIPLKNRSAGITATNVKVAVSIPNGVIYDSTVPSEGSFNSTTMTWNVASLSPGDSEVMMFCVEVTDETKLPGNVTWIVTADQTDTHAPNDQSYEEIGTYLCSDLLHCSSTSDLFDLIGVADGSSNMGGFNCSLLPTGGTVKSSIQELECLLEDVIKLSGVPKESEGLGTFTGTVIPDNADFKEALQALENAVGSVVPETTTATNVNVGGVGVFKEIVGGEIRFKGVDAGSAKINVTEDVATNRILVDLGAVDLNDLADTNLGAIQDGQAIIWDVGTGAFIPHTIHADETNLGYTPSPTQGVVTNDDGTDATIPAVSAANAGLMLPSHVDAIDELELNQDDLVGLTGVGENETNLGGFFGAVIPDDSTIKQALQSLENCCEANSSAAHPDTDLDYIPNPAQGTVTSSRGDNAVIPLVNHTNAGLKSPEDKIKSDFISVTQAVDLDDMEDNQNDLITLTGRPEDATHLGTFTCNIIDDNSTIYGALQDLETALCVVRDTDLDLAYVANPTQGSITNSGGNGVILPLVDNTNAGLMSPAQKGCLDDIITLSGMACGETDLGTFTGTIIPDGSDIKDALQALEIGLGNVVHPESDLAYVVGPTNGVITNTNGDGFTIPLADATNAGLMSAAQRNCLTNISTTLGVNCTDDDLGTFTGVTIPDGSDIKDALQALETGLENVVHPETDLAYTPNPVNGTVTNSNGDGFTIPLADVTNAGLMSPAEKSCIASLATLTGVACGDTDLDTFTGATIPDNENIKDALQALETALENIVHPETDLAYTPNPVNGTVTNSNGDGFTIPLVNATNSGLMSPDQMDCLDSLATLSGMACGDTDLGTFTGAIIPDDSDIKDALQALETGLEDIVHPETDLAYTPNPVNGTVTNSNGDGFTVPLVNTTNSGLMSPDQMDCLDSLATLSGMACGETDLGTFAGSTITDDSDIKEALQALETGLENIVHPETDLAYNPSAVSGVITNTNGDGVTIPLVDATNAGLMSPAQRTCLDNMATLSGMSCNDTDMGLFTGTLIPDNVDIKDALQALETAFGSFTADGTDYPIVRGDAIQNIIPSVAEVPSPVSGDTATVLLSDGNVEKWSHNGTSWSRAFVVDHNDATNLAYTANPLGGTVTSSTGTDATLPLVDTTNAGLMAPADKETISHITVTQPVNLDDIEDHLDDVISLTGMPEDSTDLGTFTCNIIPDNSDIKSALQALETDLCNITHPEADLAYVAGPGNGVVTNTNGDGFTIPLADATNAGLMTAAQRNCLTSIEALSGVSCGDNDLGSFSGGVIPDNADIKDALQALETELEGITHPEADLAYTPSPANGVVTNTNGDGFTVPLVDATNAGLMSPAQQTCLASIATLTGVACGDTDLDTFTGTTIPDNVDIKDALQALETALEGLDLGEDNTASNVGVGGIGLFKQKTGVDLEFRNINAGSNKITVTLDNANNEVDIDLNLANMKISDLSDVSATAPGDGETLVWNQAAGQYIPGDAFDSTKLGLDINGTNVDLSYDGTTVDTVDICSITCAAVTVTNKSLDVTTGTATPIDHTAGIITNALCETDVITVANETNCTVVNNGDGTFSATATADGSYSFNVISTCSDGTTIGAGTVFGIASTVVPPTITADDLTLDVSTGVAVTASPVIIPNTPCSSGAGVTYTTANLVNCTVVSNGDGTFDVTATADGAYSFDYTATCSDGTTADTGAVSGTAAFATIVVAPDPTLVGITGVAKVEDHAANITANAVCTGITYSLGILVNCTVTLGSPLATVTPTADGAYSYELIATCGDGTTTDTGLMSGTATALQTITADNLTQDIETGRAETLSPAITPNAACSAGAGVTYTVSDLVNCTVVNNNDGTFDVTATDDGSYSFDYTATCVDGTTADDGFIYGVAKPDPTISILDLTDQDGRTGTAFTTNLNPNILTNVTCEENAGVTYVVSNETNCTVVSNGDGTFTVTITADGDYSYDVEGTCDDGTTLDTGTVSGTGLGTELSLTGATDSTDVPDGETRDFVYIIENEGDLESDGQIGFNITLPVTAAATTSYDINGTTIDVNGGTAIDNSDWDFFVVGANLLVVSKPGVVIPPGGFSKIGFTFTTTGVVGSSFGTTGTIISNTGGDVLTTNNSHTTNFNIVAAETIVVDDATGVDGTTGTMFVHDHTANITANAACSSGAGVTYAISNEVNCTVVSNGDGTFNTTIAADGAYSYDITGTCQNGTTTDFGTIDGTGAAAPITADDLTLAAPTGVATTASPTITANAACSAAPGLTYIVANEVNCTVVNNNDGTFDVTATADGTYSFDYTATCSDGTTSDTGTVDGTAATPTITVADDDAGNKGTGTLYVQDHSGDITANGVCSSGSGLTYAVTNLVNCTVVDNGDGTVDVTPTAVGAYSYDYTVTCSDGTTADTGAMSGTGVDIPAITVNDRDFGLFILPGLPNTIDHNSDIIANTSCESAPGLTYAITNISNGTAVANNNDGTVAVTLTPGWPSASYDLTVTCSDGTTTDTGTMTMRATGAQVVIADDLDIGSVNVGLATSASPTIYGNITCSLPASGTYIVANEVNCTVVNNNDGTFDVTPTAAGVFSFDYTVTCQNGTTSSTSTVSGTAVNVQAITAGDLTKTLETGIATTVSPTITPSALCSAAPGVTYAVANEVNCTVTSNGDGTFDVTPTADGAYSFDYTATCSDGTTADTGAVSGTASAQVVTIADRNFGAFLNPSFSTVVDNNSDITTNAACEAAPGLTYTLSNTSGGTYTNNNDGTVRVVASGGAWSYDLTVTCSDGTTLDAGTFRGTTTNDQVVTTEDLTLDIFTGTATTASPGINGNGSCFTFNSQTYSVANEVNCTVVNNNDGTFDVTGTADGAYSFDYTTTCVDGTTSSTSTVSGTAGAFISITADDLTEDVFELIPETVSPTITPSTACSSGTGVTYTTANLVNCTVVNNNDGTFDVTAQSAAPYSFDYTATCSDGTTADTGAVSGDVTATQLATFHMINSPEGDLTLDAYGLTTPIQIDWGDGNTEVFIRRTDFVEPHAYATNYTGNITVRTVLSDIHRFRTIGSSRYDFDINDLNQFPNLTTYTGGGGNLHTGDIANVPPSLTGFIVAGQNTLTGDIATLPNGLSGIKITGQNTITGDIANLPTSSLNVDLGGPNNTVSGDIANLPAGVLSLDISGQNTTTGDLVNLPVGLTRYWNAGLNTTFGLIDNLPAGVTNYNNSGNNTTSGDIGNLPVGMTNYNNTGSNTTSGDIANITAAMLSYRNEGNNTTFGDLANLPNTLDSFINEGLSAVNYTTGITFNNGAFFQRGVGLATSVEVDQLLIDLAAIWVGAGTIVIDGPNAPRTAASDAAVATLLGLGVTVSTN